MHACGHDVHMTTFLGTAIEMINNRDKWSGTLMMILQPAEEISHGAKDMLKYGLFEKFPVPEYNLALHVNSAMPAGTVGITSGYALANVDSVDITVKGSRRSRCIPANNKRPYSFSIANCSRITNNSSAGSGCSRLCCSDSGFNSRRG